MQPEYRVTISHRIEDIDALASDWDTLLDSNPRHTVFLSRDWMQAWWQALGNGCRVWLVQVHLPDGRLAGLAPLAETVHGGGLLRWRRLSLLGTERVDPDHTDMLALPEHEAGAARAVLEALLARAAEWDVLYLHALWPDAALRTVLPGIARKDGLRVNERENFSCPYTTLPGTWEAFEQERLSRIQRKKVRRYVRKLEEDFPGQVAYRPIDTPEALTAAFDRLVRYHRDRMAALGKTHDAFDTPALVRFHRTVAEAFLRRGWLHFHALTVTGEDVALLYCFRYGGRVYDYQSGYNMGWSDYSPGHLLTAHSIRRAIELGVHEYDMLLGAEEYKTHYADQRRSDINVEVVTSFPAGRRRIQLRNGLRGLRRGLRALHPQRLRARLERLLRSPVEAPEA